MKKIFNLRFIRICVAIVALSAVTISIYQSGFSIFQCLAQFTYISNISVIIVLLLAGGGLLHDKNAVLVLPQILLTYLIFMILLSKGINNETTYSLVEHYFIPLYFVSDYFLFVRESQKVYRVLIILFIFVIGYVTYIFIYGYFSSYYPYFFIDLNTNSVLRVAMTVVAIILLLFFIYAVIAIVKKMQIHIYNKILERRSL